MIIKSMARKQPSFGQLIAYFDRGHGVGEATTFAWNLYESADDRKVVEQAFVRNYRYLPKRARGNALYHELISLEKSEAVSKTRQAEILKDLAERYLEKRAPGHLAFGRIHQDRDHQHIHLMISSNAVRSDRRRRLSRAAFAEIQREMEAFARVRYPELEVSRIYARDRSDDRLKTRTRENAAERRTSRPSKKTLVKEAVEFAFERATGGDDLKRLLADQGLTLYQRGKAIGVMDQTSGKRYRLKTLGLEETFETTRARFEHEAERTALLTKTSDQRESTRELIPAEKSVAINDAPPAPDPRADLLLRRRAALERVAEDHLRDFEEPER